MNPQGRSFARLRVSDLVRIDSRTAEVVEPLGPRSAPVDASASSIHAPIYRQLGRGPGQEGGSETGAEAIVHVHGPHSKGERLEAQWLVWLTQLAFSALGRPLDRINQDVCAFDGGAVLVPFGGKSPMLYRGTLSCSRRRRQCRRGRAHCIFPRADDQGCPAAEPRPPRRRPTKHRRSRMVVRPPLLNFSASSTRECGRPS